MLRDNLAVAWIFRKKNDFEIFFANLSEGPLKQQRCRVLLLDNVA